jgi:tRNA (cytidine/uridine-2'-O-)-methyltransferase
LHASRISADWSLNMNVVLVEPEIPPNTGNIARLCAATLTPLHLVGRLGFQLTDSQLKRAGLDYWPYVDLKRHSTLQDFLEPLAQNRLFFFSKQASVSYTRACYREGDFLIFGSETRGLPDWVRETYRTRVFRIPMFQPEVRSLNLSSAVAIVLYEALRQLGRV